VNRLKIVIAALSVSAVALALAPAASADTVSKQGVTQATKYRGGNSALGGIKYELSVEVARDPAGEIVNTRAEATITKISKVAKVQVDVVKLGTSTAAVLTNSTPVNSGAGPSATSRTGWRAVSPRTCTNYRVRADFSVRWSDGAISKLSVLTPYTSVCGPTSPPRYANCTSLNQTFPHGVGRPGAVDHTSGTPVTNFYVSAYIYNANTGSDRDNDGIACEKA